MICCMSKLAIVWSGLSPRVMRSSENMVRKWFWIVSFRVGVRDEFWLRTGTSWSSSMRAMMGEMASV